jgi:4-amino-4-deoxy-L-arabinose transferase-like glycosyltransferase
VHIALRPMLSATVGTDDVDQLFFAQSLSAGYSYEQTPLYTWITWIAVQAFGPTVFTVGLVKYSLVFGIHAFTYLAGRQVLNDPRLQVVAGLSPMTFYPIGWRLHEADTYGVLATLCVMALLWAVLLLLRELLNPAVARQVADDPAAHGIEKHGEQFLIAR